MAPSRCERPGCYKPASGLWLVQMAGPYGKPMQRKLKLCAACGLNAYDWRRLTSFTDEHGKEHVFTRQVVMHIKLIHSLGQSVPLDEKGNLVAYQRSGASGPGVSLRAVYARDGAKGRPETVATDMATERQDQDVENTSGALPSAPEVRVVFVRLREPR